MEMKSKEWIWDRLRKLLDSFIYILQERKWHYWCYTMTLMEMESWLKPSLMLSSSRETLTMPRFCSIDFQTLLSQTLWHHKALLTHSAEPAVSWVKLWENSFNYVVSWCKLTLPLKNCEHHHLPPWNNLQRWRPSSLSWTRKKQARYRSKTSFNTCTLNITTHKRKKLRH